jgi:hypothetical protein
VFRDCLLMVTRVCAALGRAIKGFDDDKWRALREKVVLKGSLLKFEQNPSMQQFLLSTEGHLPEHPNHPAPPTPLPTTSNPTPLPPARNPSGSLPLRPHLGHWPARD